MSMKTELETIKERWQDLIRQNPGEYSAARYRVGGTSRFGVFILSRYPGKSPAIEMGPISSDMYKSAPMPVIKGVELGMVAHSGQIYLSMDLRQEGATDVFLILAARLCEELREITQPITAYAVINNVLSSWKSFFSADRKHLSESSQTGLYGELLFIRMMFDNGVPAQKLLSAWRGSEGSHQDFHFPKLSAEVKSTVAVTTDRISISSLRQLENIGTGDLYLIQVILDLHENGDNTLPSLVDDLRKVFVESNTNQLMFEEKLLVYGYRDEDNLRYSGRSYTLRKIRIFPVHEKFPKLITSNVEEGVLEASYVISLSGLIETNVDFDSFTRYLKDSDDK